MAALPVSGGVIYMVPVLALEAGKKPWPTSKDNRVVLSLERNNV